ncbi:MAG TPA: hypothetical protein VN688_29695 [Gemmataceae bacterium]|nr:hypothetical protein [Gemmataceae bacterium]
MIHPFAHYRPGVRRWELIGAVLFLSVGLATSARAVDIDRDPINYSNADAHNVVERLQQRLDEGQATLSYEGEHGYLRSLLRELKVPSSSQMLVFSKTSLQRQRINPRTPRAIYFGDDAYVGFCQKGDLLEVTAVDPQLGSVYYSLSQKKTDKPQFKRQTDNCLICHASSFNQGYPGHLVRSVFADGMGLPILASGTYRIDHSSPLNRRWGGWYVTGTSGKQTHLGNMIVRGNPRPDDIDNSANVNVANLDRYLKTSPYLTPHSDIVALMVLEHQTEMHNRIARANFLTRIALRDEADFNKALGRPADYRSESTLSRIKNAGEPVVKYLLFCEEAQLTEPVKGTSGFAEEFAKRGPRDRRDHSLRDLDLKRRLFTYPCSYLIYSEAFDGLPAPVKDYVLRRLWDVLNGKDTSKDFAHLSGEDRRNIVAILRETKPNLPDYWKR